MAKSVLVDTSFLITVYDDSRPNHETALKYYKYFLDNSVTMYLSTIVIAEFHQGHTAATILTSGHYIPLPFNVTDAIEFSNIAHDLGNDARRGGSRPEYRDDLKIMAQAKKNNIDYIITDDHSTLMRYCTRLSEAEMFNTRVIPLNEPFNMSWFNEDGQTSLL